jgi:Uncharacterized conserved protein (some members contain a von Willebrand factor type A (vWA) domain)
MGSLYIKKFVEERELTVLLLVDRSSSAFFGTKRRIKSELVTEISALLGLTALRNNDRVGLIIFTSEVERFIPPKKGKSHVLRLIRELVVFEPKKTQTGLSEALAFLNRAIKRRSVVFLISDFMADISTYEKPLAIANKKHELVALQINDPAEKRLPEIGWAFLEDAETGEKIVINTAEKRFNSLFAGKSERSENSMLRFFQRLGVDRLVIQTSDNYMPKLLGFFRKRRKKASKI